MLANKVNAFHAILTLRHNFDIAHILKQEGEFIAGQLLIVHDHCG